MQRVRRAHAQRQHAGRTEPGKPAAEVGGAHTSEDGGAKGAAGSAGAALKDPKTLEEPRASDDGGDAPAPAIMRPPGAAPPQDAPFVVAVRHMWV